MTARTVLITGANAGIGFAAAVHLARAGHRVLLGCRDTQKGEKAAERIHALAQVCVEVIELDMASRASVHAGAARVMALGRLDVIVHNAAFFDIRVKAREQTEDGLERTWATNVVGPALLTELLMPRLLEARDARVVAITSKGLAMFPRLAVNVDDANFIHRPFSVPHAYYQSKLAHLAWMLEEATRWRVTNVRFHALRVGNVRIDLERYPGLAWPLRFAYRVKALFATTPAAMAQHYAWLCDADRPGATTGMYWDRADRLIQPSRWASDADNRRSLIRRVRMDAGLSSL